jgi:hypothetical protein
VKDLIRSPLQFVRPMTENEWCDLVSREARREIQRTKRRDIARKARLSRMTSRRVANRNSNQVVDSSARC